MTTVRLALHAMATRFEMVLHGENAVGLRAAGEEALAEVERLEGQLSLYRETSEVAHLNARAAQGPVRVTPSLFGLLEQAGRLHRETGGAFDITIAPLVRCWGFMGGTGGMPDPAAVAEARGRVGMERVELDPEHLTVRFTAPGVMLDLGAIGKGYAIDQAMDILREAGVTSGLLHGGTSTVYGLGRPPEGDCWKIAVQSPRRGLEGARGGEGASAQGRGAPEGLLATVPLRDEAMSVSAVWGRSFQAEGKTLGHVLDPRTGWPVAGAVLAAVVLPSATESDALSTALLVRGLAGREEIARLRPGMKVLVVAGEEEGFRAEGEGIAI